MSVEWGKLFKGYIANLPASRRTHVVAPSAVGCVFSGALSGHGDGCDDGGGAGVLGPSRLQLRHRLAASSFSALALQPLNVVLLPPTLSATYSPALSVDTGKSNTFGVSSLRPLVSSATTTLTLSVSSLAGVRIILYGDRPTPSLSSTLHFSRARSCARRYVLPPG